MGAVTGRRTTRMPSEKLQIRKAELRQLAVRSREVVLLSAVTGVVVGLVIAGFEHLVVEVMLHEVLRADLWVLASAPVLGLVVSALLLRYAGHGASSATTDEYIQAYHDPAHVLGWRAFVARFAASIATLGSGGPMGLEGPSVYTGSTLGSALQRRFPRVFRTSDPRLLLVAGAAAGVAAIFKAPATGAIFALEVPYRGELARRMLLPALVSSASGYLTFVAINGTTPLFRVFGQPEFGFAELLGAAGIGVVAAIGARAFAKLLRYAKRIGSAAASLRMTLLRSLTAGAVLVGLFSLVWNLTDEPLTVGPGFDVITWAAQPEHAAWLLAVVLVVRCVATAATVAGGGVGGLFIPLVVAGALSGQTIGTVIDTDNVSLFPVLGVAAFLGAGYRVPLAAIMFVSETTGRPGFIVPGLIAAVVAELVMGEQSITAYQRPSR